MTPTDIVRLLVNGHVYKAMLAAKQWSIDNEGEWVNEYTGVWRCKRCGGYFSTMNKCNACGTAKPKPTKTVTI